MPIATEPIIKVLAAVRAASTNGVVERDTVDRCVEAARLPAAQYSDFEAALSEMGVRVIDPAAAEPEDESAHDGGWNADGFGVFMAKSAHRILSFEEEQALGARISRGRLAIGVLAEHPDLPFEQRRVFERQVRDGKAAADDLALHNIRLVVSIASQWSGAASPGLELEDLVAEGYFGLARAIEKWDHTRGLKLSTYATWWIRQTISRAIADKSRVIRLPVHLVQDISTLRRARQRLRQDLEREPTIDELAEELQFTTEKVTKLVRVMRPTSSLDLINANGGQLGSGPEGGPEEQAVERSLSEDLLACLSQLSEREKVVICRRFGLDGHAPGTLEDIGVDFGVTRERIRQIESQTLAKLRHPHRAGRLEDYLDD